MDTTEQNIESRLQGRSDTEFLVIGGNGKTGRRVLDKLNQLGRSAKGVSRGSDPSFDWSDPETWRNAIEGASAIFVTYYPDLASPGAAEAIRLLVSLSKDAGVGKLVLLSGRGEEEAQLCESIVAESGIPFTIVRCSWFNQNFSENFLRDMVLGGTLALPVGEVREPFVDAEDIADVVVAALTDDRHNGEIYELTGPELLSFQQVAKELSRVTGKEVSFQDIPHHSFIEALQSEVLPEDLTNLIDYLFSQVLDGRNASLSDGVQRALGREPRSFAAYAREAFSQGYWNE